MTADVVNQNFEVLGNVDEFESFIWTERCREHGDFELVMMATPERQEIFKKKNYIIMKESDRCMIIDTVQTETSAKDGNKLVVSGKSLEYLLHKRIIWDETVLTGSVQDGIQKLLNENAISPSKSYRKIPRLRFKKSTDPRITNLKFKEEEGEDETQYWRENLYEVIEELCNEYHICFKVALTSDDQFEFSLFAGVERTFDQSLDATVVFSPEYGNLISSTYLDTDVDHKNAGLIVGEKRTETYEHNGVSTEKDVQHTIELGSNYSGLDREEMDIDMTSLSMYVNDIKVPEDKYLARLRRKGETELRNARVKPTMEAEVEFFGQFQYARDYFIGDIVEVENHLGNSMTVRITEVVRCHDESGDYISPAFTPMTEEEDPETAV